ncbi:MAG: hypothetical protein AAGJ28_00915 [Pseudomonadota bacterium]
MLTPNGGLALLVLWPLLCIYLIHSMSLMRGILWSIFAGFMLLPVGISLDLPALPALDKVAAPSVGVFLALILAGQRPHRPGIESKLILLLLVIMVIQPVFTALTNGERSFSGPIVSKQGLTMYDAISTAMRHYILIMPFLIGYRFLGSEKGTRTLVQILLLAGLGYSLLMLIELRMSPQMHRWVYGYFQHSWIQMLRDGGYRPIVFLNHALWVAFFAMTTAVAAAILWRAAGNAANRTSYLMAMGYMLVVLVMCKSLGSMMFASLLVPLILFTSPRLQVHIAAALAVVAMLYPALRGADLVPVQSVVNFAASIEEERASSLQFRLNNEDILLERANKKPYFGWGGRGRNLVYDERGEKITIIDGYWTIVIGQHGWFGYIAQFGLLGLPILILFLRMRRGLDPGPIASGLALLLAANMIELLPNATLMPWTWLLAGALLGFAEKARQEKPADDSDPQAARSPPRPRTVL